MEEIVGKAFPMQRVVELYKDEGLELTTEQAEKILALSQKLVNLVVTHYRTAGYTVDSFINSEEVS